MTKLPNKIYRTAQVRELDQLAISGGVPGYTLMCRAGQAALNELRSRWPRASRILVLCGAGNNGGDGYVVGRLAHEAGLKPMVVALTDPEALRGDARLAWEMLVRAGLPIYEWEPGLLNVAEVVVDGILGTGIARPLEGRPKEVVQQINQSKKPVLALDVPTGLNADTGQALGEAIRADATVTFVGLKLGLYTGAAWDHTGDIVFADLDIASSVREQVHAVGTRIDGNLVHEVLPPRSRAAHKGNFGRVVLVGGGAGMPGAIKLAAEAALFVGAGTVTVLTRPEHVGVVLAGRPELMVRGVDDATVAESVLSNADVIAVGPGLGVDSWGRAMLDAVLKVDKPTVVDADGLNCLVGSGKKRANWVLTPHPGEAARLLQLDSGSVQRDRLKSAAALLEAHGGIIVLKGPGTIVATSGEGPWICDRGNPGMAAPGMGDVLTGVIAGVAGQCGDLFSAARAGVFIHGAAGDDAAKAIGQRGLVASNLMPYLVRRVNLS